jgi:hypothetical protein
MKEEIEIPRICLYCIHFANRLGCSEGYCRLKGERVKEYSPTCKHFEPL